MSDAGSVSTLREDRMWREAAEQLGLDLFDDDGREVRRRAGTREHRMRGRVNGYQVEVRYGLKSRWDGITVIEVRLNQPMMLGFRFEASAPPRTSTGVVLSGIVSTQARAIEQERAERLLATDSGKELRRQVTYLGSLGWARVGDALVEAHSEIYVESSFGYVDLVGRASAAAALAEAARIQLEPAAWEAPLSARLERLAGELGLEHELRTFSLRGKVSSVRLSLRLEATESYSLRCEARVPRELEAAACVRREETFWTRVKAALGLSSAGRAGGIERTFKLSAQLRGLLNEESREAIRALGRQGELRIGGRKVLYRTKHLDEDISESTALLLRIAVRFTDAPKSAPYR